MSEICVLSAECVLPAGHKGLCSRGEPLSSNLKLCADLRAVAEQLDRPDGWGRAALSVRGAIDAIERLTRERDEYARCLDGGVDCAQEKLRLRAALEHYRTATREFMGDAAVIEADKIAREALRGAAPAGETDTSRVAQIRKAPYPESARSQGGGRAHSQGEAAGSTPASGLPVEAKTAVGSGPCQHPFRTHWTGGGDKTGVTCATCGAELAEDKTGSETTACRHDAWRATLMGTEFYCSNCGETMPRDAVKTDGGT